MPIYNQQPRPRVLFEAVPEEIFEELAALVPTAHSVKEGEEVHDTEYDLVVTRSTSAYTRDASVHVLSFGADVLDPVLLEDFRPVLPPQYVFRNQRTLAMEASIPSDVDGELRKLLERTVVATIPVGEKYAWTIPDDGASRAFPLVELGAEKSPYALMWEREEAEGSALVLALPAEATEYRAWLAWFLQHLHEVDPKTFPGDVDWASSRAWATARTAPIHGELGRVQERKAELLAQIEQQERDAQDALDRALKEDAVGLQRLLTADGDELEEAVHDALAVLGFSVQQMDDHHDATTKAKLEDLRVKDPDEEGWICLVEIKGYSKGAKTNDVNQIVGRPMRAYIAETRSEPSTVWHVVNTERGTDPTARRKAIPNDVDLELLTDANGALIDTRQLFLAVRDVQLGRQEASAIRKDLRIARTRWDYRVV
ncbi:hypothetical protein ACFQ36_03455 [Arthrobacter sp. GCM10027362]|uniref:hypothetical protein n=1 Tax=Arthrobacter sp. GCM10027362 TaxID=3273379 RepID=UPI00363CC55F